MMMYVYVCVIYNMCVCGAFFFFREVENEVNQIINLSIYLSFFMYIYDVCVLFLLSELVTPQRKKEDDDDDERIKKVESQCNDSI
jgi:hypothetical protein